MTRRYSRATTREFGKRVDGDALLRRGLSLWPVFGDECEVVAFGDGQVSSRTARTSSTTSPSNWTRGPARRRRSRGGSERVRTGPLWPRTPTVDYADYIARAVHHPPPVRTPPRRRRPCPSANESSLALPSSPVVSLQPRSSACDRQADRGDHRAGRPPSRNTLRGSPRRRKSYGCAHREHSRQGPVRYAAGWVC